MDRITKTKIPQIGKRIFGYVRYLSNEYLCKCLKQSEEVQVDEIGSQAQKPASLPQFSEELAPESNANNNAGTDLLSKSKNSSRRNAWEKLSYADLITLAIQSSPEQRLTLSQIFEWLEKTVPFFKDKGDSDGWKCSIKHNLSLNSRFKSVPNEGQGKSGWWMMNPESIPKNAFRNLLDRNLSYADLITLAIQSAPEQKLTYSQICEWFVKNLPYFKNKGDIPGWKMSIKHNLHLRSCFKRVHNQGQGESSWWMMDPESIANDNSGTDLPSYGFPKQKNCNCSQRNAWEKLSYRDLITLAIQSAPEQRLTYSQICEWMVKTVPYFKDKGDIPGWKCSIKHNLSLNSRFKRVQNEGQGESSWWMMNPESIPNDAFRNLSYADYITLAIQSTPEKRLTLSQIYEWVVKNVPHYKDKGESFGWKCSIRHNLYFSNRRFDGRFKKVQIEGQGESGWWMMNPDAAK